MRHNLSLAPLPPPVSPRLMQQICRLPGQDSVDDIDYQFSLIVFPSTRLTFWL